MGDYRIPVLRCLKCQRGEPCETNDRVLAEMHEPDTVAEEQLEALRARVAAEEAVASYAAHDVGCACNPGDSSWPSRMPHPDCDCGLTDAWRALSRLCSPTDSPNSESPAVPERMEEE